LKLPTNKQPTTHSHTGIPLPSFLPTPSLLSSLLLSLLPPLLQLEELPQKTLADLEATFNDPHGVASYMVWYCRLLTAGFLKKHREEYEAFLDGR